MHRRLLAQDLQPELVGPDYFKRNTVIVRGAETVVAFWNGTSRGTLDSINEAIDFHGYCIVVTDPDPTVPPGIWREKQETASSNLARPTIAT